MTNKEPTVLEKLKRVNSILNEQLPDSYLAAVERSKELKAELAEIMKDVSPRLIETLEWVEGYAQMTSEDWGELDLDIIRKVSSGRLFARELLTKLEGEK